MDITYEHIRREFQALSQTSEIRICILERSLADSDTFMTEKHPLMLQMQMILRPHIEKKLTPQNLIVQVITLSANFKK